MEAARDDAEEPSPPPPTPTPPSRVTMDVLTVGDGDLSFSLALQRAYPTALRVHPSTLVATREELVSTYPDSSRIVDELERVWKCPVNYGVDATRLDDANRLKEKFDLVLFNHPHLGDLALVAGDEGQHADRHHALLAHYFHTARSLLKVDGAVHVCLCGTQPSSWRVRAAAERCGLTIAAEEATAVPVERWLFGERNRCNAPEMAEVLPHYPVKRKFRNGSLGSKHALARYGYRHRRTEGESYRGQTGEISVEQSVNFVFRSADTKATNDEPDGTQRAAGERCDDGHWTCQVCKLKFASREDLEAHESSPALPDIATGGFERKAEMKRRKMPSKASEEKRPDESMRRAAAFDGRTLAEQDSRTIIARGTVTSDLAGSRIRWLCRQKAFPLSLHVPSKKRVDDAVKRGSIFVNDVICIDTARILNEGDTVTLVEEGSGGTRTSNAGTVAHQDDALPSSGGADNSRVRLVESFDFGSGTTLRVMFKPVGVRCDGSFSEDTLEMQTKSLADLEGDCPKKGRGVKCLPISKVDTGVGGLCVLATGPVDSFDPSPLQSLTVTYTFTALVHGRPDWDKGGVYCRIPAEGVRQWKKRKAPEQVGDEPSEAGTGDDEAIAGEALNLDGALHLQCLDSLRLEDGSTLSTISARSSFDSGRLANVISYTLRSKLGLHVVNDRFSRREFAALPRRMRNLVRQSVCIACYAVDITRRGEALSVNIPSHQRTSCGYWRKILDVS